MSGFASVRLVAGREVIQKLRSKPYLVFTGLLCAIIIGAGFLNSVVDGGSSKQYRVGVLGPLPQGFEPALQTVAAAFGLDIAVSEGFVGAQSATALRAGTFDAIVDPESGLLTSLKTPDEVLRTAVEVALQRSQALSVGRDLGLSAAQLALLLEPRPVQILVLDPGQAGRDGVGAAVGTASAVLLFISINFFGNYVLMGVVEEKSTGVVEVLLSQVKASQLLAGKVLGIGLAAMAQFAAATLAGLVALKIADVAVPTHVWVGLPVTLLWFIAGFLLYATLFALAGSFVSRQEDAQGASAPISMVFTLAYIGVFTLGSNPDATVTRIVSILPPFAPMLMPVRIAVGSASLGEIALAAILVSLAVVGMLRLAGSVYARTLLHRGARLRWRQALRLRRSA